MALVPLVLVPLAGLLLGISGHAESGTESFLFAQPVSRVEVLLGRWAGQVLALSGAVAVGFGGAAALLAATVGAGDLPRFLLFVVAAALLGAAFLSLSGLFGTIVEKRGTGLGLAAFAWCFFVLLYDALMLSTAASITGRAGGRLLFLSVFGNPTDLVRVLVLSLAGTPHVLGPAGDAWILFLGGAGAPRRSGRPPCSPGSSCRSKRPTMSWRARTSRSPSSV